MDARSTTRGATPASDRGRRGAGRASGTATATTAAKPRTKTAANSAARAAASRLPDLVLGAAVRDGAWLTPIRGPGRLAPGQVPKQSLTVPADEAQRVLRGIIRHVVDIQADTSSVLVWQRDDAELWVDVATVTLTCFEGLVRIGVKVGCDEITGSVVMTVPIGVGRPDAPTGLVMSSVDRLDGPDLVASRWSDAITAFAWEALLELARRLCAELGRDASGLPLIPGSVGAAKGQLLIQPMSRNDLSKLGG